MQQSFKLLEFNVYDDKLYSEDEENIYLDNKEFLVQMFGLNEYGKSASILVTGFKPRSRKKQVCWYGNLNK